MGANTKIEWAHHTFNPVIGCTPVSEGCRNCYAAAHALRFSEQIGSVFADLATLRGSGEERRAVFTGTVRRTSPDYWRQPLRWNRYAAQRNVRERVFCASMSDVLDAAWDESLLVALFGLIQVTPSLDWLLLTKRPENFVGRLHAAWTRASETGRSEVADMLCRWSQYHPPPNVWMGVTIENDDVAADRLCALYAIPAAIRFVSAEPLIGPLDLNMAYTVDGTDGFGRVERGDESALHWLICGGESGPNARPMHADHARLLRDQCHEADVNFFFKQWGEHDEHGARVGKKQSGRLLDGREWNEVPA